MTLPRLVPSLIVVWSLLACGGGLSAPDADEPAPEAEAPRQAPTTLTYKALPGSDVAPQDATFTAWEPGDQLVVGIDNANLRASASTEAEVVGVMPIGSVVTIEEVASDTLTLVKRRNRWYRVQTRGGRSGYLFGSLLIPTLIREDLDGDGGTELLSVTFSPDFRPRIRVAEPSFASTDDRVVALDLPMGTPGVRGGEVRVEVLEGQQTPWRLLHVSVCDAGSCDHQLAAYLQAGTGGLGYLSSVAGRPEQITFTKAGFQLAEGDAPYAPVKGRLSDCSDCAKLLVRSYDEPELVFRYFPSPSERDAGPEIVCNIVGEVIDELHRGHQLVGCGWHFHDPDYFVAYPKHWLRLGDAKNGLVEAIEARNVSVKTGPELEVELVGAGVL